MKSIASRPRTPDGKGQSSLEDPNAHRILTTLVDLLDSEKVYELDVIPWACPVPSFGDVSLANVATLGLNPSNREFVDGSGEELRGSNRRFPTLHSLGLSSWSEADSRHLRLILDTCRSYFLSNPYDVWFKKMDQIVSGLGASYYGSAANACHLDLAPFATARKWTELLGQQRAMLLSIGRDTLGLTLRHSTIQAVILNGRSVVTTFQELSGVSLDAQEMQVWSLPRKSTRRVVGVAYRGIIDSVGRIPLDRQVLVLGFNHNLQSSFGVTAKIIDEIGAWVAQAVEEIEG